MTVVLFRVDERLIHGQVVVGWGRRLEAESLVVVSDELAGSASEQEIYRTALPSGLVADFWSEAVAAARLPEVMDSDVRVLVLTPDLGTMWRLAVAGVPIREVNVGGLHAASGRQSVLPYVYLAPDDRQRVRDFEAAGVRVTAQDVPGGARVRLERVL
ncbi:MAG TPA: PTS sugar transporter subunit IIB [Gemmatimonadota bacterium]|nr:PTS sugar transporter subunit IIB [Gemmatimonadota bacterium]